ncbi:MAG: SIR2 family protein [Anaerovoracaceae bacterium]
MQERKPILLLGAGFSIGAKNAHGLELPKGDGLSEILFDKMYPGSYDASYIKRAEQSKHNLKELCSLFRTEDRIPQRNGVIADVFAGSVPGENRFHDKFTCYPWSYIFTLNVDDLIENIYRQQSLPLNVWNTEQRKKLKYPKSPLLVKLHGCVHEIGNGVIFDDVEYRHFTTRQSAMLKEFANQFVKNDVVVVGSEFQEDDLQTLIELYQEAGYDNSGYDYFFVSPSIKSLKMENIINKYSNFHKVDMTTEDFLTFVDLEIKRPEERRSLLKEHGAFFVDDYNDKSENYSSKLYSGDSPRYQDFFREWHIRYPEMYGKVKKIIDEGHHYIISITGKQYVGKTCAAKRFLVDFRLAGFEAFELIRLDYPMIHEVNEYLEGMQQNSKVAILIDDSAFQYKYITRLSREVPTNISQLVIIVSDSLDNHNARKYLLKECPQVMSITIKENVQKYWATQIFNKLLEKARLGKYLELLPPKQNPKDKRSQETITQKMLEIDDIIDILYYTSNGRSFKAYYDEWLKDNYEKTSAMYLEALCFIGKLGVNWIPTQLIASLVPLNQANFNLNEFENRYREIITIQCGRLTIRRRRMIQAGMKFEATFVTEAISSLILEILDLFSEYERNEYYEIFQKVIRTKKLKKLGIPSENIYAILQRMESYCKEYSYFWIQYGIAAQMLEDYESATNHLNYAKHLQPESFSVKHALAKNLMEIGLYKFKHNQTGAENDFSKGKADMLELVVSKKHIDNYLYSVHTYVDLMLTYSNVNSCLLQISDYKTMQEHLTKIAAGSFDSHMKSVIDRYVQHCKKKGVNQYCEGLVKLPRNKVDSVASEDEYETDLIDS